MARRTWSTVAGKLFDPDASKCEHGFKSAWEAIAAGDRPVTGSMRDYLEDDFKPEPESMSCLLWENALQFASETTCSTALKQRFERYFKTCTKPVAVAMLRLPAPPVAGLALEHIGYRLTIMGLLVFFIGIVERKPPLPVVLVSVGFSLASFYVIGDLLHVPLPVGPWGF